MFVMFCLSILRTQLMAIFMPGKESSTLEKVYDTYAVNNQNMLIHSSQITQRAKGLLTFGGFVSPTAFAHRKIYFNHATDGLLVKKVCIGCCVLIPSQQKLGRGLKFPKWILLVWWKVNLPCWSQTFTWSQFIMLLTMFSLDLLLLNFLFHYLEVG